MAELEGRVSVREKRKQEILQRRAWNTDNICRTKEEKSLINRPDSKPLEAEDLPDPESEDAAMAVSTGSLPENESPPVPAAKASVPKLPPTAPQETTGQANKPSSASQGSSSEARERFAAISYNDFAIKHEELLEQYSEVTSPGYSHSSGNCYCRFVRWMIRRTSYSGTVTSCCTSTPRPTCCSAVSRMSSTASMSE